MVGPVHARLGCASTVTVLPTPSSASLRGSAASNPAGTPSAPTPTMSPWPGISRGTDCTVPMVPGLVRVTVVPAKSSGAILLVWILRTRSS